MMRHHMFRATKMMGGCAAFLLVVLPAAPASAQRASAPEPRRPSMVGYIEDSTIATGLRVRFDVDQHITNPDRAEFFYGKCGCYRGLPANNTFFDASAPGNPGGIAVDVNANHLFLRGEYAIAPGRLSLFAELPIRWLQPKAFAAGS